MSVHIRKCTSELSNGKPTKGYVLEVEFLGCLIELCFTRQR